jgi:hypothetical protein
VLLYYVVVMTWSGRVDFGSDIARGSTLHAAASSSERVEVEIHDLKLLWQRHFSDGLVSVVGSGLSCAEGLPSMSELATHLQGTISPDLYGNK